jgi:hypothetical protein
MSDPAAREEVHTDLGPEEKEVDCQEDHVADLDEPTRRFLSTYSTIRSKIDDLARAESDVKRFELSIEQDRKRLQKTLEAARLALKNARVQMATELGKIDAAGFAEVANIIKAKENGLA